MRVRPQTGKESIVGQSNTIAKQQELNEQFRQYVQTIQQDLDKTANAQKAELTKAIEQHYSKINDHTSLASADYRHLTTVSEWSLSSLNDMIGKLSASIFGAPPPANSKHDTPTPEVTQAIKAMANLELYIANVAFDVIQGLLVSLDSSMSTGVSFKSDVRPLMPGLRLFITVIENSYERKDFFSNDKIIQSIYIFDARYSLTEAKSDSAFNDAQAYENQKESFREQLQKLDQKVAGLDPDDESYETKLARYEGIARSLNDRLEEIAKKLDGLKGKAIVDRISARRAALRSR
jgi:chromosome segregation ATPase